MKKNNKRKRMNKIWIIILLIIISLGALGTVVISLDQPDTTKIATEFSLIDLNGSFFKLSDFRGKIVLIDFMATYCQPCRLSVKELKIIWENYNDKIVLISIDVAPWETSDTLSSYVNDFPYATWIWALDTENLALDYEVEYIPKMVIIDQTGNLRFSHLGVTSSSILTQEIDQLLGE